MSGSRALPTSPEWLTAAEMVAAFRGGTLSPIEVTTAALQRIERLNPRINAFYLVDHEGALKAASESERRWREQRPLGPFDGVPTSIKEAFQTTGHAVRFGSAAADGSLPAANNDAPVVARLKESGAVILGRTTMCDFGLLPSGYSTAYGPTRNPWAPSRTSGGSSAGAAASIAAGINPVAVGSDIVGSIRLPASFCGLVGHKPSQGRVPFYFQNSPSLVAGPMGRTVEDVARLMTLVCRPDPRDYAGLPYDPVDYATAIEARPETKIVGLLRNIGFGPTPDDEVLAIVEEKARALAAALGAGLVELTSPIKPEDEAAAEDFYRIRCLTGFQRCDPEKQAKDEVMSAWTAPARHLTACDGYARFIAMQVTRDRARQLFSKCDFVMLPSVAVPAFAAELPGPDPTRFFEGWSNTFVFNLTEQPAVSVPAGLTGGGLPVGLQIVGRRFDDVGVLRMARLAELTWGPFPASPMLNPRSAT